MGAIIGFIVGYVLGTREGEKGRAEMKEAWQTIRTSDEARYLVAQGISTAKGLLQQGSSLLADRLQTESADGTMSPLRPTG